MFIRRAYALALLIDLSLSIQAWSGEPTKPALLDFLAPSGAQVAVDGKDIAKQATFAVSDLKPKEIRRLKVDVKFADGGEDEHFVDVQAGQRIPVPLPKPGKDKPLAVATHPLAPIMSAAISRDGRFIVAGMDTGAAVLWDLNAGRPTQSYLGHRAAITSIALSPDARQVLTGSTDATAILWDAQSGKQSRIFKGHEAAITSVAISPDAQRVLTSSIDKTAILWNAATGEPLRTLKGHKKEVASAVFSPDGATIATASFDATAVLWDAETGKEKLVLRGHREEVSCIAFSPDGNLLGTGSYENKGIVWDAASGKRSGVSGKHDNDIYSIAFTADGTRLITGDREGVIVMVDFVSGKKLRDFTGHIWEVSSMAASADGRTLVTGSRDGTAKLWDMATGLEVASLATDSSRKSWAVTTPSGYFDGSESGRRMVGYRFTKLPGAVADQFFNAYYRPGLLPEIVSGGRPFPQKALGYDLPPRVKIVSPTTRTAAAQDIAVTVDVVDQGGGVSGAALYNNSARMAAAVKSEPGPDKSTTRLTFAVSLVHGVNKIRVKAACADGSWEAMPAELEMTYSRSLERKSRMYVVAVGVGAPEKGPSDEARNAQALADLLRLRGAKQYERVDVLPLLDQGATRTVIEDSLRDVAELTRPQDTLVLVLCGTVTLPADRVNKGNKSGDRDLALDSLAEILGSAHALHRVLIVDGIASSPPSTDFLKTRPEFGLRGAIERLSRLYGLYTIAATQPMDSSKFARAPLAKGLLAAAHQPKDGRTPSEAGAALDVTEWFHRAAEQANVVTSSQARGFPILSVVK